MKKTIASVLCLCLLVGILLTGCSAPTIVGTWKGQIDMANALNNQMAQNQEVAAFDLHFENIYLPVVMEFTAEGQRITTITEEDLTTMATAVIDQMLPGIKAYMEGMGISLDTLLAASGMTTEAFMQQMVDTLTQSMNLSSVNTTATYKAENGILYIGEDAETAEQNPYTLEGDKLTILAGESDVEFAFMFPLVLERVK